MWSRLPYVKLEIKQAGIYLVKKEQDLLEY